MKISLNSKFVEGPFGGGMQFANYLKSFLEKHDIKVINHLKDNDIDIILHINPFPFLMSSSSYSAIDAYAYKCKYPNTIIIQRINECDERKGTNYMNKLLIKVSNYSDHIIFIADWLKPLFEKQGFNKSNESSVILNGADNSIFNSFGKINKQKKKKLKIITHHWGANFNKGHKIYKQLDALLDKKEFSDLFDFTFIGNIPENIKYKNTKIIGPLEGKRLAAELKKSDIYITASINEPAGMHHIEAALCGLPLLYINSGALPQYCNNFGLMFQENNFEKKLLEIYNNFEFWKKEIKKYNKTAEIMAENYLQLFNKLLINKKRYSLSKANSLKSLFFSIYSKINFVINKIKFKI